MTISADLAAILDGFPPAPVAAWRPAHWEDVPKGFYAIPIWDWHKFGDDCGTEGDPTPPIDLIGFQLCEKRVSRTYKTGRKAGQQYGKDEFKIGKQAVAPGVTSYTLWAGAENETCYMPWDRLRQEIDSDRHLVRHDLVKELPPMTPPCRCCTSCRRSAEDYPEHMAYVLKPGAYRAWDDALAGAILDVIANHGDIHRRLYGVLTGQCGKCHALLTDPTSKLIGIGPDCRGYR